MSVMIDGAEAILVDRNKGDVIDYSNKNIHNYPGACVSSPGCVII